MAVHTVTTGKIRIMIFTINLDKWGVENLFQNDEEVMIRELKVYIKDGKN